MHSCFSWIEFNNVFGQPQGRSVKEDKALFTGARFEWALV